jgi:hypothetical protein
MDDQQNERILRWLKDGNTVVILNEQGDYEPASRFVTNHISFYPTARKAWFPAS